MIRILKFTIPILSSTNPSWSLPVPGTAYHSCTYNKVGSIFLQRQSHGDSSAVAELALYKHVSVVVFNQASRNRQPYSNAVCPGCEEGLKNMLKLVWRNSYSCITYDYLYPIGYLLAAYG